MRDESDAIDILVAGDLYPGGRAERIIIDWPNTGVWQDVLKETGRHHLSIANLESPLTRRQSPIIKSGPHLRADPLCAAGIRGAGFDVLTLANNHILDMGADGIADTIEACDRAGLLTVGAGKNFQDATRLLNVSINGIRLTILSLAEREFSAATSHSAGAWPLDPIENYYQLQSAKETSDFILVIVHGGNEYYSLPSPGCVKTCRFLVDAGAHAVVCHHIHVPSGLEIYREAPIIYSTGNFLFDEPSAESGWFKGYLVSLSVRPGCVTRLRLIPYHQCRKNVEIRFMQGSECDKFLDHLCRLSKTIPDETLLKREWKIFCDRKRDDYLSMVYSLNALERKMLKMKIFPFWRINKKQDPILLNLFRCEAHRNACIEILNSTLRGQE